MSLYHETAAILSASGSEGGSLKSRVFGRKELKSPPAQVYALALESCKWSGVLKEVIEHAGLLQHEKKISPILSLLLVHDFLLSKSGIALPASHGLRAAIERHKARVTSEFTRARLRRKAASVNELKEQVEAASLKSLHPHPRWVRVNTLKSSVVAQLETTFSGYQRATTINDVCTKGPKHYYIDEHVPNLLALSPGTDLTKAEAYKSGALIFQDKASCFPAHLLSPRPEDGDVIDSCAAPGNKTTHLAAILRSQDGGQRRVFAFEKDKTRSKTLEKMVATAGANEIVTLNLGKDFLRVNPDDKTFANVSALLLDPSCSGSGIVGRDDMPELHLPEPTPAPNTKKPQAGTKRKRGPHDEGKGSKSDDTKVLVDDDGRETVVASEKDLATRLEALAGFQLALLLHAFHFPAATKITYSTCSVHFAENEGVVASALRSEVARRRGWRVLRRAEQLEGMREWPVRGEGEGVEGLSAEDAEGCVRAHRDDGRGVMGFFVVAFVRDPRAGDVGGDGSDVGHGNGSGDAAAAVSGAQDEDESDWGGFED